MEAGGERVGERGVGGLAERAMIARRAGRWPGVAARPVEHAAAARAGLEEPVEVRAPHAPVRRDAALGAPLHLEERPGRRVRARLAPWDLVPPHLPALPPPPAPPPPPLLL